MRRGDAYPPWLKTREFALAGLLVGFGSIMLVVSEDFRTLGNLYGMAHDLSETGLMALGMTLVILTGGIDLSVGSIMGLAAVILGLSWEAGVPVPAAALLALLAGSLAGGANGWFISRLKIPPFLVTLATLMVYRGLAQGIGTFVLSNAKGRTGFLWLSQGYLLDTPVPVYIFAFFAVGVGLLLQGGYIGRYLYAVGTNETATYLAGINVPRLKLGLYTFNGFLAGLAAVLDTARAGTAHTDTGVGLEVDIIAAVVLGGTCIAGGKGNVFGTVLGLLFVTLLRNSISLLQNTPPKIYLSSAGLPLLSSLLGLLLLAAAALDRLARRKSGEERENVI